ncbi:MAG: response regulator [Pseudomonadota bacterium]
MRKGQFQPGKAGQGIGEMENLKVAIIDDEMAHARLMERSIKKTFPHAQVDWFEQTGHCLNALDDLNPDIIISDYLVPDMDGLSFLEELRRRRKDIPVIVISGYGEEKIAVKAMKLGAYECVWKSKDFFSVVPGIVRNVLRQKQLERAVLESQVLCKRERNKLKAILAGMANALAVINADLTIGFGNAVFKEIFGNELIGKPHQAIFRESVEAASQCRKAIEEGQTTIIEFEDVNGRSWHVTVSPGMGREGEADTVAAVLVFLDVTECISCRKRLQHLSERLIHAQEEERSRISRELHDALGQTLTALKFDTFWLQDHFGDQDSAVKQRFEEMYGLIDDSISVVRKVASDLRPGILDDVGLGAAVEWYASEFERRSGIECVTLLDMPGKRLVDHVETAVYRIIQEALNNVARHAKASAVTISMKQKDAALLVEIADDGIGMEPSRIRSPHSTGMFGMRERAEILSGTLEVKSYPGKGTQVSVQVPVKYRPNADVPNADCGNDDEK